MTVTVGITTPDAIVLASDSRMTHHGPAGPRIMSDSSQKIFDVGRFGVATAGWAFIAENTIAGLMDQFLAQSSDDAARDVNAFTNALGEFFHAYFAAYGVPPGETWNTEARGFPLMFQVAGYDRQGIGHIYDVKIPGPQRTLLANTTTQRRTVWQGQTDVIDRLLNGVDWVQLRLPHGVAEEIQQRVVESLQSLAYIPLWPATMQDAVDYASFLIRTTIDMQRFSDGTAAAPGLIAGCGGPLQILVVERSGTRWATKPELRVA